MWLQGLTRVRKSSVSTDGLNSLLTNINSTTSQNNHFLTHILASSAPFYWLLPLCYDLDVSPAQVWMVGRFVWSCGGGGSFKRQSLERGPQATEGRTLKGIEVVFMWPLGSFHKRGLSQKVQAWALPPCSLVWNMTACSYICFSHAVIPSEAL